MRNRLGLLLILLPMIASAAFMLKDAAEHAHPAPAPKKLEAPSSSTSTESSTPTESSDDSHSQVPQRPPGEIIGVPMLA